MKFVRVADENGLVRYVNTSRILWVTVVDWGTRAPFAGQVNIVIDDMKSEPTVFEVRMPWAINEVEAARVLDEYLQSIGIEGSAPTVMQVPRPIRSLGNGVVR